jgi:hypothetical protein
MSNKIQGSKLMYEHHKQPLLTKSAFLSRMLKHTSIAFGIIFSSLGIGMIGYHALEGLSWIDSLVNASMILGGMGPVDKLQTDGGKIFASVYALYSGLVFLVIAGVLFIPVFHRFLHHFHLELEDGGD